MTICEISKLENGFVVKVAGKEDEKGCCDVKEYVCMTQEEVLERVKVALDASMVEEAVVGV